MKKFLFPALAVIFLAASADAQTPVALRNQIKLDNKVERSLEKEKTGLRKELKKLKGEEVGSMTKDAFISDFGNIPGVQWSRLDYYDEAIFTKDGHKMSAYYDFDTKLVGTIQVKKYTDVPAKAQAYISKNYKGYTPGDVIFFNDNEQNETDMIVYGNQFADVDSYFVELSNGLNKLVVQVTPDGEVGFFAWMR